MGDIPMETVSRNGIAMDRLQYPDACTSLDQTNVISIDGVYKRYGNEIVLNNLNMTVPQGCIYGLLGSSGCGKTTLLNCIMGMVTVDTGKLYIKYNKLSDIGLMPQDTSLVLSLTIRETLNYFGKMFNMSDKEISNRNFELTELLKLPNSDSRINELSGGEQRRVSLAVAFLHNPKLLLLDEPTVGLDPILSKSIWDYIIKIANVQHKTIIITTHYIEEAKQAHFVSLMRQGKLAETGPPAQIMEKYNCSTLEEAFLQVCQKDKNKTAEWPVNSDKHPFRNEFNKNDYFSFARFRAQFYKNSLYMIREKLFMTLLFVIPMIQCNSVHWALGRDPNGISLAVVNDDVFNCSTYNCTYPGCLLEGFSCCYLEELQERVKNFNFIYKDHFSEGKELVERNDAWGLIHFPTNFSRILKMRIFKLLKKNLTNETIESGQILIYLDSSDIMIDMFMKRKLFKTFFDFMGRRYNDCGWESRAAQIPMKLEDSLYGSNEPAFSHLQTPAIILAFCFFLPMTVTPSILLDEKQSGFLPRSIASGLTVAELFAALVSIQVIMLAIQVSIVFTIFYAIYEHPFLTNLWLPFAISIYAGISGMCFGIFVSVVSKKYYQAIMIGNGMLLCIILSQGGVWPIQGAHPYVKHILWYSPLALAVNSLRNMTVKGWTLLNPSVYSGFLALTAWSLLYIILSLLVGIRKVMTIQK